MILQQNYREVVREGDFSDSHKMHVSREAENHLIRMATEWSYKSPLESGLREAVSNAVDSHVEAGVDEPVIVRLKKNEVGKWLLEITDVGLGLDDVSFKKYIMGVGESTKRDNPKLLGGYGAGAKAFCSYSHSYEYLCRKDGIERKYLIFKGEEIPENLLIWEKETNERNGVIVTVPLDDNWNEFNNSVKAVKEQLCYLDNIYYDIPGFDNNFKIFKTELFQWNSLHTSKELHISLKNIYYPINWSKLGINRIDFPIALRFDDYEDIQPVFNREELIWNSKMKEKILQKIKEVADWFVLRFNSQAKEYENLWEAHGFINRSTKNVNLQGTDFDVNNICSHSLVVPEEVKVKGMTWKSPFWYKGHIRELLYPYSPNAWDDYDNKWRTKHLHYEFEKEVVKDKLKVVLFNKTLSGNVKEYLRDKYGKYTLYVSEERKLSLKSRYPGATTYLTILTLDSSNKSDWRKTIEEFQSISKSISDRFVDETNAEDTEEFSEWLEEKKERQREERKNGNYSSGKPLLDKDRKTEITIGTARKMKWKDEVTFDKRTRKVFELHKHKRLSVYRFEKDIQENNRAEIYRWTQAFPGVDFVIVNPSEEKHVKDIHNYVHESKFSMTKPFARLFSALMVQRLLQRVPDDKYGYIEDMFPKWESLCDRLKEYRDTNLKNVYLRGIEQTIIDEGISNNSWDTSIQADYSEMTEVVKLFYFLPLIQEDRYYVTPEQKADKKRLVASMLLFQKRNMEGMKLVPDCPAEVEEQMYIDPQGELAEEELETA